MVRVAVLDVNETMFSLDAVGDAFAEVGLPTDALPLWFARLLRDGFAVTAMRRTASFPELARHHTRALAAEHDVPLDDGGVERVLAGFGAVEAQPDVEAGLRLLADAGVRAVPYTNGSAPIVAAFLERTGLDALTEPPLDVSAAGLWKPDPQAYRWACRHLDVVPTDAAMVAVHPWDVVGAQRAGLAGAWVHRQGEPWPPFLDAPTHAAPTFDGVAALLSGG